MKVVTKLLPLMMLCLGCAPGMTLQELEEICGRAPKRSYGSHLYREQGLEVLVGDAVEGDPTSSMS